MKQFVTYFDSRPLLARGVFLLTTVLVLAYSGFWMYRYASIATDENLYTDINGRVTIISVMPGGASDRAGLLVGDTISAINGKIVRNKFEANYHLVEGSSGNILQYTIIRDGVTLEVPVVVAEYGLPLQYLATILTGLLLIILAAFVFVRRPGNRVARLFGWTNLVFGFALLVHRGISVLHYPDTITAVAIFLHPMLWPVSVSLCMHLMLHFPVARYVRPVPQPLLTAMYATPFVVFTLLLFIPRMLGIKGIFGVLIPFLGIVAVVFLVLHLFRGQMKNLEPAEYGVRARAVLATRLFAFVYIGAMLMIDAWSAWQSLFFLGVLIPLSLFAVIVKQRLFDLYIVVRRRSMYSMLNFGLSTAVSLILLAALVILPRQEVDLPVLNVTGGQVELLRLSSLSQERRMVFEKRLTFSAGVLLIVALWWLYRGGRKILDERFYRGSLDYKRALTAFSKLSHSHADPLSLAREVVAGMVKLLHVKGAVLALRGNGGFKAAASHRLHIGDADLAFNSTTLELLKTAFDRAPVQAVDNLPNRDHFVEHGIEFLAAVQLEGRLEALLLLGQKESDTNYSREDVELLENLAINIGDALLTMRFYDGAREKERLRKELEIARQIQMQSLPTELPEFPGIAVAAESIPAYEVGGDFYDVLPRHDSATFIIGDVSGKGTSAAMYLARMQGILKTIESFQPTLWELLTRLNTLIFDHIERKSFVTLAALRVDFLSSDVRFLRAGHLPLVHYNALSREVTLYRPSGMAIGLDPNTFPVQLEEETIFSRSGDVFVLVSDGVTESAAADGEQFGIEGVMECVRAHADLTAQEIKSAVISAARRFNAGEEQEDDITVLVVKCSIQTG